MNLSTLELDPVDAAERLREYEAQLVSERTDEDRAIAAGYRAAARGLPVISLSETIAAGGWFSDAALPRLAVVRADATECWARTTGWWGPSNPIDIVFARTEWSENRGALVGTDTVRVTVPRPDMAGHLRTNGRTIVPLIPPQHRPNRRRIHRYHVLWEVEKWDPTPPIDPALLKHIRGDLWAVVATWDLTPLERNVLTQRTRSLT